MICGGTQKRTMHRSYHIVYAYTNSTILPWRTGTSQRGNGPCPLALSRSHLRSRTLFHPDRLATLDMTICACLTDSYDSTHMLNLTVWQVCDTVCADDQGARTWTFSRRSPCRRSTGQAIGLDMAGTAAGGTKSECGMRCADVSVITERIRCFPCDRGVVVRKKVVDNLEASEAHTQ